MAFDLSTSKPDILRLNSRGIIAPTGSLAAGLVADHRLSVLLDEAQGKATNHSQFSGGVFLADPAVIFAKEDIETPVQTVF